MAEKYLVRLEGEDATLELDRTRRGNAVRRDGDEAWKECRTSNRSAIQASTCSWSIAIRSELYLERRRGGAIVTIGRHTFDYDVGPWRAQVARRNERRLASGRAHDHRADDRVYRRGSLHSRAKQSQGGPVLLVIESMKMNNELRSPAEGVVETVPVTPGQRVKAGELAGRRPAIER